MSSVLILTTFFPFFSCSWDNLHLRARRSPHHIYLATQWPAEYKGRPAGSGLQHAAEGGCSGQGRERQRTGRLSGAAHSKRLSMVTYGGVTLPHSGVTSCEETPDENLITRKEKWNVWKGGHSGIENPANGEQLIWALSLCFFKGGTQVSPGVNEF